MPADPASSNQKIQSSASRPRFVLTSKQRDALEYGGFSDERSFQRDEADRRALLSLDAEKFKGER